MSSLRTSVPHVGWENKPSVGIIVNKKVLTDADIPPASGSMCDIISQRDNNIYYICYTFKNLHLLYFCQFFFFSGT